MAAFRYIVHDVTEAVSFYRDPLGFELVQQFGPEMAIVTRGDLQLWLAGPPASASRPMPDGSVPSSGALSKSRISSRWSMNCAMAVWRSAATSCRVRAAARS